MLRGVFVEFRTELDGETRASIERIVESQPTLEEVVRWALSQKPARLFARCRATLEAEGASTVEGGAHAEVESDGERNAPGFDLVIQDEFTHDVVVPWNAAHTIFLVYDTT